MWWRLLSPRRNFAWAVILCMVVFLLLLRTKKVPKPNAALLLEDQQVWLEQGGEDAAPLHRDGPRLEGDGLQRDVRRAAGQGERAGDEPEPGVRRGAQRVQVQDVDEVQQQNLNEVAQRAMEDRQKQDVHAGGRRDREQQRRPVKVPSLLPRDEIRPWYIQDGARRPEPADTDPRTGHRLARLWPEEEPYGDRIENQLMYVQPEKLQSENESLKKILLYNGLPGWPNVKPGQDYFIKDRCPVNTCTFTVDKAHAESADAVFFKDYFRFPSIPRSANQVWILFYLESPYHTQTIRFKDTINWTATYRRDSDLVAPYYRWTYYNPNIRQRPLSETPNYAANKTKKVAWFVSNCAARNGRLQYARELAKYIQVDIYGACGDLKCPRSTSAACFKMLDDDYKFYLAFENSNCKDYITEKFFENGLGHNVIPIAMGAQPEDYFRSAPLHSYIMVDDFESPKELAEYLHELDQDDELYNSYFRWRGTGEFINTHFMCRLCAMLHDDAPSRSYKDVESWWRGPGVCTTDSWRKLGKHKFSMLPDD